MGAEEGEYFMTTDNLKNLQPMTFWNSIWNGDSFTFNLRTDMLVPQPFNTHRNFSDISLTYYATSEHLRRTYEITSIFFMLMTDRASSNLLVVQETTMEDLLPYQIC